MSRLKPIITVCLLALLLLRPKTIQAQSQAALDLNVSPAVSYLYVKPGAGISTNLTVSNQGRYTIELTPQLVDFHPDPDTGRVVLDTTSQFPYLSIAGNAAAWGQNSIIKPAQEISLPLVIAVPSDIAEGEYHLSVLLTAKQLLFSEYTESANTDLSGVIASHIVLMVSQDESDRSQLQVTDFRLPKVVDSLLPLRWQIMVRNTGFNAGPIEGQLTISHWPAREDTVYRLYPDMVLADSQRPARYMTESALAELEKLSQQTAVLEVNGEDPAALKADLISRELSGNFVYQRAFLLGAYDFSLELGEEVIEKRVIALPFSLLAIVLILPIFYRLLVKLLNTTEQSSNKVRKDD